MSRKQETYDDFGQLNIEEDPLIDEQPTNYMEVEPDVSVIDRDFVEWSI